ncbi:MAG TPA: gamma-glutamyl-gamma-aminobutyrate hydrolase family protein [Vicinamibacterales bacterium]|nr:gamma-glutamyl-gamma-aminobutyrate hydrolase family protein [Vicinamibacterales bacterium]
MSGSRPIIGITKCSKLADYQESVRLAGGDPVVIDWNDPAVTPEAVLSRVDGLLLTGGRDVEPALYAESPHGTILPAEPGRDVFELSLSRAALARDVPLLAVCRGMQVVNVAAGGTLIQDIPTQAPSAVPHAVETPKNRIAHEIAVVSGTRTWQLLGREATRAVNSRHHQAVQRLGDGFVLTAEAPDHIVEAMERPEGRFCVAVQWHPENFCDSGEFLPLFEALVKAARNDG